MAPLSCIRPALVFVFLACPAVAFADCQCTCVNGDVRAICSSSIDLEPICPPRVCPIVPPSVQPVNPPRVPPVGTSRCYQRQIWDEQRHRYVWRQVCS